MELFLYYLCLWAGFFIAASFTLPVDTLAGNYPFQTQDGGK